MFLESLTIKNFRKFRDTNNTIHFVDSKSIKTQTEQDEPSLIAPSSTLIIGKNNTGKTTIARALSMVSGKIKPSAHDFNVNYLKSLIQLYEESESSQQKIDGLETPHLEFVLNVRVNITVLGEDCGDLVNNLYQFAHISSNTPDLITIIVRCQIKEEAEFRNQLKNIINADYSTLPQKNAVLLQKLEKLSDYMRNEKLYKITHHTASGSEVTEPGLEKLIKIKEIKANRPLDDDNVLSKLYQRIISSQLTDSEQAMLDLHKNIDAINTLINNTVIGKGEAITDILKEIEKNNHVGMGLSGDVTEDTILRRLIKYSFSEGEDY